MWVIQVLCSNIMKENTLIGHFNLCYTNKFLGSKRKQLRCYIQYCVSMWLSNASLTDSLPFPSLRPLPATIFCEIHPLAFCPYSGPLRPSLSMKLPLQCTPWHQSCLLESRHCYTRQLVPKCHCQVPTMPPTLQYLGYTLSSSTPYSSLAWNISSNNLTRRKVKYLFCVFETWEQLPNSYFQTCVKGPARWRSS